MMTRKRLAGVLLLGLLVGVVQAEEDSVSLQTLDELVGRWLELRTVIAEERRDWQEQQAQWRQEIELLKHEREALQSTVKSIRETLSDAEEDQAESMRRQEELGAVLAQIRPLLDRAENGLRELRAQIPDGVLGDVAPLYAALPPSRAQAERLGTVERAQQVMALYGAIERLQNGVHVVREMLPDGAGGRRQAEVLYLGLARGFAVSPQKGWAAIGQPRDDGWQWQQRDEAASDVRRALAVINRETVAQLVELPMQVDADRKVVDEGGQP
jgi:uncharacterized protein YukE